ncbi:calcium-translocating P-type ATPase, PMCA-type [Enterococcus gallinarum]|uniref:P-type Ca(2+) transporter n=1 Tax=Enterococcus gallinarum TaxID=1353 RepID=A0ABD4HLU3_ENTGA|nr:calcium-translocating P-type ATPase, PMCA-type [Enterococcus gallinarum]MBA0947816.1 calcium-translocating P-type ATPase, PMCA-type [Enterococcus gallinarum]MBA0960860.1 calcium-translocating P-type ATPase, PMCA-type [Enterococcus gallinarum]MBA0968885.1 calcium-translocating P-type ATPase, PMCA-type [Enterococcus gallinarum]MBA0972171.1 calcium-translocating P-type ATPase, PMCA-type [Enterococcus gallinarum]NVI94788.1 calcium-translocating P-type ATPase, PMCA-type [Enterococcus gallinarum]
MNTVDLWFTKSKEEVLRSLDTNAAAGLSSQEVEKRLQSFGRNELEVKKKESLLKKVIGQLEDPMIIVLLIAAFLSYVSSGFEDWIDSVIILLIVVINAIISISQENNANKSLEALQKMSAPLAKVIRNGKLEHVETATLVPGDIIELEAGDLVPADVRILSAANLKADESAMTGESVPVNKKALEALPEDTVLADRKNMLISSTVITNGRATCVVTSTGMKTEVGRIANMLISEDDNTTPLQRKMAEISKLLSIICLGICVLMFIVGLLYSRPILEIFMMAVSLGVAAIPEGLAAIVTIVLALGVQRLVKRHAIVKKLPAVETLGAASVICSDKTGTLTQNKMTVVETFVHGSATPQQLLAIGALCNDSKLTVNGSEFQVTGDPTETAFVSKAYEEKLDKNELEANMPRVAEIPFDSERKLMSTIHKTEQGYRVMVKGAPDVLLNRCRIDEAKAQKIAAKNADMASNALRVLGVAYKDITEVPEELTSEDIENHLTFVGLVGMIDPPRQEVKEAVAQCYDAGIRPVMITGDHKLTAVAIAKELNIFRSGDLAMTGSELDMMPQEILEEEVEKYSVYARVSPEHKMRIVKAWQAKGMVVAMTGDGVNDAPALKVADIGCAMGITGTDVAKGAADMILTDDNFATIVHAVEQGRGIFSNIKKSIQYLLSCNIGEIITIFVATALNFHQMPLVAIQLLWLNLVTDSLPALALGMEPVEPGVMKQKPRDSRKSIFADGFAASMIFYGVLVGAITLAAYWLGEYVLSDPTVADGTANTMAFATLVFGELTRAFAVRSETRSIFSIGVFSNSAMNKAFLVSLALQLAVLFIPFLQEIFKVQSLTGIEWVIVILLSLVPLIVSELTKAFRSKDAKVLESKLSM